MPGKLKMRSALAAFFVFGFMQTAWAADRFHLFYSNDSNAAPLLDRWRTVALAGAWEFDKSADRHLALQLGAEIIAPVKLSPVEFEVDRPFAGIVHVVGYDHRRVGPWQSSFGLGVSATGPQTMLAEFLDSAHSVLNGAPVAAEISENQVPDRVYLETRAEVARVWQKGEIFVRPFVAARSGVETLARAGFDLSWRAPIGSTRMPVTGAVLSSGPQGWHLGAGMDTAYVIDTQLIPDNASVDAHARRTRLRASAGYRVNHLTATFGLAWLGPEFLEQTEGQFIGTLGLSFEY